MAHQDRSIDEWTLGDAAYRLVTLPRDVRFGLAVTDIFRTGPDAVRYKVNFHLFERLHDFLEQTVAREQRGDHSWRMSPISRKERLTFSEHPSEIVNCLADKELKQLLRRVSRFYNPEELAIIFNDGAGDRMDRDQAIHYVGHMLILQFLARLLKDPELLGLLVEMYGHERNRWKSDFVRKNLRPKPMFLIGQFGRDSIHGEVNLGAEIEKVAAFVSRSGFPARLSAGGEKWAKDSKLWFPRIEGEPYYYLEGENVQRRVDDWSLEFRSDFRERYPMNIAEGGASVSGVARTPFFIFADSVDAKKRDDFRERIRQLPKYEAAQVYTLPAGWTTLRWNGNTYLLDVGHIDTVMGFIPARFTESGRAFLLIDPWYHREIGQLPEFKRFLADQAMLESDVVEVSEDETGYNPANFVMVGDQKLLFNYAPRTLEKTGLKPGMYDTITKEEDSVKFMAVMGGGIGCLVGPEVA